MTEYKKKIELSERLTCVASLVSKGGCVADVGCDHGFVSIFLVQNHLADRVIAMDVNEGPLARAKEHVTAYEMEAYIQLRLSDGLKKVSAEDHVDTVVLAGMGGKLMEKILSEAMERGLYIPELVLQPQSDLASLRKFLRKAEYTVTEEKMVLEEGKFYPMMQLRYQAERRTGVDYESEEADAFGPILMAEKHPLLHEYLLREIKKFEHVSDEMQRKKSEDTAVAQKLAFLKRAESLF